MTEATSTLKASARRLFDPMYRRWFRAEWEGLEKIPVEKLLSDRYQKFRLMGNFFVQGSP